MPFYTNQFGLGKSHWNLETSSAIVEFLLPYHWIINKSGVHLAWKQITYSRHSLLGEVFEKEIFLLLILMMSSEC